METIDKQWNEQGFLQSEIFERAWDLHYCISGILVYIVVMKWLITLSNVQIKAIMAWQTVEQENWPTALDIWERISLSMKPMSETHHPC